MYRTSGYGDSFYPYLNSRARSECMKAVNVPNLTKAVNEAITFLKNSLMTLKMIIPLLKNHLKQMTKIVIRIIPKKLALNQRK